MNGSSSRLISSGFCCFCGVGVGVPTEGFRVVELGLGLLFRVVAVNSSPKSSSSTF